MSNISCGFIILFVAGRSWGLLCPFPAGRGGMSSRRRPAQRQGQPEGAGSVTEGGAPEICSRSPRTPSMPPSYLCQRTALSSDQKFSIQISVYIGQHKPRGKNHTHTLTKPDNCKTGKTIKAPEMSSANRNSSSHPRTILKAILSWNARKAAIFSNAEHVCT